MGCSDSKTVSYGEVDIYYENLKIDKFIAALRDDPALEEEVYEKHRSLSYFAYADVEMGCRWSLASHFAYETAPVFNTSLRAILALFGAPCFAAITPEMKEQHPNRYLRLTQLRMVLMYNTDASKEFCNKVCETGMLRYFVEDLQFLKVDDVTKEDGELNWACESAMAILMNCSRNFETKKTLLGYNIGKLLVSFLKCRSEGARLFAWIILSNLVDENEKDILLKDHSLFDLLNDNLLKAWDNTPHRHHGFSLSNLVEGITCLAKHDFIKPIFVEMGVIPILTQILNGPFYWETEVTAQCIWELAFDESNRRAMNKNVELKLALNNLMQLGKEQRRVTSEASEAARWVIRQHAFPHNPLYESENKKRNPKFISISNASEDRKMTMEISDTLEAEGFYVRMFDDGMHMDRYDLQEMLKDVQNSSVVLVCLSDHYRLSTLSRTEAEFSVSIGKDVIPLVMQKGFQPEGWLRMFEGTKLLFDFYCNGSGNSTFDRNMKELILEIEKKGKEPQ